MSGRMGRVRIGTSGWQYGHWRGDFYPARLPVAQWLRYYAERFDTVELNNPFYRQPERATFARWRAAVPDDFAYAVKLNRFITHIKRLNVEAESVRRAYDTLAGLGPKAAVVLAQLPPGMRFDPERTRSYFRAVARRHRRHSIEPREGSWFTAEALGVLRERRIGLCIADTPHFPTAMAVTADFVYVRFHGPERLYASNYGDASLREWAERIQEWRSQGLDVFGYFNNDGFGYAPRNAIRLRELVG